MWCQGCRGPQANLVIRYAGCTWLLASKQEAQFCVGGSPTGCVALPHLVRASILLVMFLCRPTAQACIDDGA